MNWLYLKLVYLFNLASILFIILINNQSNADQSVSIFADNIKSMNSGDMIEATGNVVIINNDGTKIKADKITYNENNETANGEGNVIINDFDKNTFFLEKFESENNLDYFSGEGVGIRLSDDSRIVSSNVNKKEQITILSNAEYTPCKEDRYLIKDCPAWKLQSKKIYQDNEKKTIYYDHAKIYLFNVPIIYLPYFSHPDPSVNKRTGFLMPTIQTDQNLGDQFSIPFFIDISGNKDLTFTPNIQSKSNNFYSFDYRHLNDFGRFDIEASIDDNNDNQGTRNHLFFNSKINNEIGNLHVFLKTSNNDTYLRKNKINQLTVLESGISFEKKDENKYLSILSSSYKHLTIKDANQWEYVYPKVEYNLENLKINKSQGDFSLFNNLSFQKNLNESYHSLISSQINWDFNKISKSTGLVFNNDAFFRIVSLSEDNKFIADEETVRFYPQISSKITMPLFKETKNTNQTLTPVIMPILAPYNNYTQAQNITNSNIFSTNRSSSIVESESGPRINYGLEWFMEYENNFDLKLSTGQSLKFNKNKEDTSNEVSDYYLSSNLIFEEDKYFNNSVIIDRENLDVKTNNANLLLIFDKFKIGIDYDYNSGKYYTASEQLRLSNSFEFADDLKFNFTGAKDIDTNKNIGYQYGLLYENDCIGIDLNYYRDLTQDRDIVESNGYSFTIVLKPFGTTKKYGKNRIFGPKI